MYAFRHSVALVVATMILEAAGVDLNIAMAPLTGLLGLGGDGVGPGLGLDFQSFQGSLSGANNAVVDFLGTSSQLLSGVVSKSPVPSVSADQINDLVSSSGEALKTAGNSMSEWLQPTSAFVSKHVDTTNAELGKQIVNNFDAFLDANPDFKLSTSEYTSKFLTQKNVELDEVMKFLDESPAADNLRSFSKLSTSEATSIAAGSLYEKSTPLRASIDVFGGKLYDLYLQPIVSSWQANTIVPSSGGFSNTPTSTNFPDPAQTTAAIERNTKIVGDLASSIASGFAVLGDNAVGTGSEVAGSATNILSDSGAAIVRAFTTLGAELSTAGDKLVANVGAGLAATGDAIGSIPSSAIESFSKAQTYNSDIIMPDFTIKSTPNPSPGPLPIQTFFVDVQNRVGQWSLFSDPDHMKNGYWEQLFTKLSHTDPETASNVVANTFKEKATLLGGKWDNYVNDVTMRVTASIDKGTEYGNTFNKNWNTAWASSVDKYNYNMENAQPIWEEFSRNVGKNVEDASKLVQEVSEKTGPALSSVTKDLKEYSTTMLKEGDL
jgi:hypothetical protein